MSVFILLHGSLCMLRKIISLFYYMVMLGNALISTVRLLYTFFLNKILKRGSDGLKSEQYYYYYAKNHNTWNILNMISYIVFHVPYR